MSLKQQASGGAEVNERMAALVSNASAIRAIASAVEGTLGPKGLDTMLVDSFGEVIITNDGVTILSMMEANHPAARMLINIAKAQQQEIGDGTTTATVLAGSLVGSGVEQVSRGVPVARVIEGLRAGVAVGVDAMNKSAIIVKDISDPIIKQVALVAGRGQQDIAELVVKAAEMVGIEKLLDKSFKLSDIIVAEEGAENQVFKGVILSKERMNRQMPIELKDIKVLVVDDALEPEDFEDEALSTEAGFARYMELQNEFKAGINKVVEMGVGLVLVDRGVSAAAEEILTDAGVMVVQRVLSKDIQKAAEHTGSRIIKRNGLKKDIGQLAGFLGKAGRVYNDEHLEQVWIQNGVGKSTATVLVGAATLEVVGERERIAKDAAAAIQSAIRYGVVPGGGSVELAASIQVEKTRSGMRGMSVYG
ncbi:MAG: chaperonin, partial [Peptococcaceae bacterium]|nr:chaperonin [Peptococcaceae bacterium]